MQLPKHFCIAPFFQHTTHPSASCSPCPYLGGTSWAQPGSTIMQQWHSPRLSELRRQFLQGQQPELCHRCWHEEAIGKRSLRQRLFDPEQLTSDFSFATSQTVQQRLDQDAYLRGPLVLTIKNGNVCNAKCRVCHPNDSSRWISDAQRLYEITGQRLYNLEQVETNWSDQQLEEIVALGQDLTRLELFGGEPVYNKQVAKLLEVLAERGHAQNMTLYINTNGSVDILQRLPAVAHFKTVEIGVSIDGVGQHFNYIRHGLHYQDVVENIKKWQAWFENNNRHYSIDSISTVQILNVYYLPELKAAVKQILPLEPFWNLLVRPDHLFVQHMPDHVKKAVLDKLKNDPGFDSIRSAIDQPANPEAWQRFLETTAALDQIRGESFRDTFTEFYEIIQG